MISALTSCKVSDIETTQHLSWMIENLWLDNGVGIIGGEPKSYKTFAAMSLAVSVASGKSCFGHYEVRKKGPVLLFAAEDSLAMVKDRIMGITKAMDVDFESLNLHVITTPKLRIDSEIDRKKMETLLQDLKPVLLVLDPFVRLHRIDENSSGEVAGLLSWLRDLQRQYSLNIVVVHHARKRAGNERPGQSLRGSSELHAWGDSNFYLRRLSEDDYVELTIEHRAAASQGDIQLKLQTNDQRAFLTYESGASIPKTPATPQERIMTALRSIGVQASGEQLRSTSGMKTTTFWQTLNDLVKNKDVCKTEDNNYTLAIDGKKAT
jgi:RecA-family ATPase